MSSLPLLVSYPSKQSVVRAMAFELGLSAEETETAVQLLSQDLPPLTRRTWIPFLFGVSPKLVGAMAARSERYYRRFRLKKRSGGFREIVTPRRYLKTIHRWLLYRVFNHLKISNAAHGFVRHRNVFTNASIHLDGANVLAVDIRNFFPSVTYRQVQEVLVTQLPFPGTVTSQIAALCTLDGVLPQGAPTSPSLANAVFEVTDHELTALAAEWRVKYSRYADDLAFSGERSFSSGDVESIRTILNDAGFEIHDGKTRILGPGARQTVAGVVVNETGYPPRQIRRRWRAMFHRAKKYPHEFRHRLDHLGGIAAFVNQYDVPKAAEYREVVKQVAASASSGDAS